LLDAAVVADGLVKFLVDCLGRAVAARLNAGRRRNMMYGVGCVVYNQFSISRVGLSVVDLLIGDKRG
jgi:hypothetical protein